MTVKPFGPQAQATVISFFDKSKPALRLSRPLGRGLCLGDGEIP